MISALLSAILLMGLLPLGSLASPAAERSSRIHDLRGVTRVSGQGETSVAVTLPEQVRIFNPLFGKTSFAIHGKGRFIGFALVRQAAFPQTWIGGKLPGSAGQLFLTDAGSLDAEPKRAYRLPAGDYRLYLISKGSRVSATLRFKELDGRTAIRVQQPADVELRLPKSSSSGEDQQQYYAARSGPITGDRGLQFEAAWFRSSAHGTTELEACFYKGHPRASLYGAPGCSGHAAGGIDGGSATGSQLTVDPQPSVSSGLKFFPAGRLYGEGDGWPPGLFSQTLRVSTASTTNKINALMIWLTFSH